MTHTATPWRYKTGATPIGETGDFDSWVTIENGMGSRVYTVYNGDDETNEANAAFIVKAVNGHDELIAFAMMVRDHFESTSAPLGILAQLLLSKHGPQS